MPPQVAQALGSAGCALDREVRSRFEPQLGYDFSRIRVHADEEAARSARALGSLAYTVGNDIVFAADQYSPRTSEGQRLIAHELTHVVQQLRGPTWLQCAIDTNDFETGEYDKRTLDEYLKTLTKTGEIDGSAEGDDKARQVVKLWHQGKLELGPQLKVLLIREMQDGFTGNDDERAILTLLLGSSDSELKVMFRTGTGIDPSDLDSDFQGPEEDTLREFYQRKFTGGCQAALAGSRELRSPTTPRATSAQSPKAVPTSVAPEAPVPAANAAAVAPPEPAEAPGPQCAEAITWRPQPAVPVDINANSIEEFIASIPAALGGNPRLEPEMRWNLEIDRGRVIRVGFELETTMHTPRFSLGRVSHDERKLIRQVVEFIRAHEARHRDISRAVAQEAVCAVLSNPTVQAAQRILSNAVCVQEPTRQEALDAREGSIEWIRANGRVTGFRPVGVRANYRDPTCR